MPIKPKLLLPDASVIITAYELDVWKALLQKTNVAVTSVIAHDEALFFNRKTGGIPSSIDLSILINEGTIQEISASLSDIKQVRAVFDEDINMGLHDGEVEAIAVIYADPSGRFLFCTSDKVAIRALAMLGLSKDGISFEEILESIGLRKQLPHEYRKAYFDRYIAKGQTDRIQGKGLPYE